MNNSQTSAREKKEIYEQNQMELNKRKGELQQKYGIIFHKELVALIDFQQELHQEQINILRQEFEEQINQTNITNQEIINQWKLLNGQGARHHQDTSKELTKATKAIETSSHPLHTQNAWATFWFSLNRYGWFAILPAFIIYSIFNRTYITEEYKNMEAFVQQYKNIREYRYLSESAELIKNPNNMKGMFLALKKADYNKDGGDAGKVYYLDKKNDQILVPVYFSTR